MPRRNPGFTLLELIVVLGIIGVLIGLTVAGVQKARAAAGRVACANNLRQIGLALHHAHDAGGQFPPGTKPWDAHYPHASWITRTLPYLDEAPAWADTRADYAVQRVFAGPPVHRNLARPLRTVLCPSGHKQVGTTDDNVTAAFTYYLGVSGSVGMLSDGVLYRDSTTRFADIADGASNTLLVGERPPTPDNHFGWWYAGVGQTLDGSADFLLAAHDTNRTFRAPTCPRGPYAFQSGRPDEMCDAFHFWSPHPGGAHFAFADGSVRFLRYTADDVLPALATRAGGESASAPD